MQPAPSGTTPASRRMPLGIWVSIGLLLLIVVTVGSALIGLVGGPVFSLAIAHAPLPRLSTTSLSGLVAAALGAGIWLAAVAAIIGLLRRRPWGWTTAVVLAGGILALNIGFWAQGMPRYWSMAAASLLVLYVNQRDVRAVFGLDAE